MFVIFIYLQHPLLCNSLLSNAFCQANFTLTTSALHGVLFHFSLLDYCISLCKLLNSSCTSTQHDWNDLQTVGDKCRQTQMDKSLPATNTQLWPSARVAVWLFHEDSFWPSMSVTHKACKVLLLWKHILLLRENIWEMHGNSKVIGWNMAKEWKKAGLTVLMKNYRWGVWFISEVQDLTEFKNN